jgi:hypothetical protein
MPISGTISAATPGPNVTSTPVPVKFAPTTAPALDVGLAPSTTAPAPAGAPQAAPPPPEAGDQAKEPQLESWRIAAIAKKEAAARRAADAAKADREAAEKAREEAKQSRLSLQNEINLLRQDPDQFLRVFGVDYYNRLSQHIAQGGFSPEQLQAKAAQDTQARLTEAERRIAETAQQAEERVKAMETRLADQKKAEAAALADGEVERFKGSIGEFLKSQPDALALVAKAPEGVEAVYRAIEEHFNATGQELGFQQAAEVVQGKFIQEARDFLSDPKVAALIFPRGVGGQFLPRATPAPTLTNRMQPPGAPPAAPRAPESEQERRARVTSEIEAAWRTRKS